MAANKTEAKGKKLHGRLPTKRTINLVLVEEGKVSALKAIPGILAIVVLAALFSKFLVMDRLNAVSQAQGRVDQLQSELDTSTALLEQFGDVEKTYAHYTLDGMTQQELDLVDRTRVLDLVVSTLPVVEPGPSERDIARILKNLFRPAPKTGNTQLDRDRQEARVRLLDQLIPVPEYVVSSWSVTGNLLTIEVNGQTLERMNELARQIERSPIVDSCTITTASKGEREASPIYRVWARFIVYLQQPEETGEEAPAEEAEPAAGMPDFNAVTRFMGGEEASQP